MSSHNTDTGNSEKGESWQLGERKLWLPGVPAPGHQTLWPGRKVSLVLSSLLNFQENPKVQICVCFVNVGNMLKKKIFFFSPKTFCGPN